MRGKDTQQSAIFSYLSPEDRVPADHPLRPVRLMADIALEALSPVFNRMYVAFGRPSIAPEKLLRALLLQVLYTIRSERMLMEQLEYNLLFRWFVGLNMDEPVWVPTVFSKNRDRLMEGDVAQKFFDRILEQAEAANLTSDEHFSVDGTLIEAWASQKSFQRKDSRNNRLRMIRVIRRSTFMARSGVTIRMSRRPTRMRGWRARAAATNRSWLTVETY
jgi:transposase